MEASLKRFANTPRNIGHQLQEIHADFSKENSESNIYQKKTAGVSTNVVGIDVTKYSKPNDALDIATVNSKDTVINYKINTEMRNKPFLPNETMPANKLRHWVPLYVIAAGTQELLNFDKNKISKYIPKPLNDLLKPTEPDLNEAKTDISISCNSDQNTCKSSGKLIDSTVRRRTGKVIKLSKTNQYPLNSRRHIQRYGPVRIDKYAYKKPHIHHVLHNAAVTSMNPSFGRIHFALILVVISAVAAVCVCLANTSNSLKPEVPNFSEIDYKIFHGNCSMYEYPNPCNGCCYFNEKRFIQDLSCTNAPMRKIDTEIRKLREVCFSKNESSMRYKYHFPSLMKKVSENMPVKFMNPLKTIILIGSTMFLFLVSYMILKHKTNKK